MTIHLFPLSVICDYFIEEQVSLRFLPFKLTFVAKVVIQATGSQISDDKRDFIELQALHETAFKETFPNMRNYIHVGISKTEAVIPRGIGKIIILP